MRISDWSSDVCSSDLFHAARSSFSELAAKSRRVIGGRMASRSDRNGLEWVGTVSRDTMRRLWIASRARHLSWGAKGGVWALSLALWAVTLHEILRLSSGAEARRAWRSFPPYGFPQARKRVVWGTRV